MIDLLKRGTMTQMILYFIDLKDGESELQHVIIRWLIRVFQTY